jgi:hypothetical protein
MLGYVIKDTYNGNRGLPQMVIRDTKDYPNHAKLCYILANILADILTDILEANKNI